MVAQLPVLCQYQCWQVTRLAAEELYQILAVLIAQHVTQHGLCLAAGLPQWQQA